MGSDGRLITIAPNCLDLAGGRLVLAARQIGVDALAFIRAVEQSLPTIDHLARHGSLLFDRHLDSVPGHNAETLWLCGWSEFLDQALLLQFDPNRSLGQRVSKLRSLVSQPVDLIDRPAIQAVVSGAKSPEEVDLPAFGRALAEAQRSYAVLAGSDGMFHHGVGGYLLQSEITRTGNRHQIIHNWPDRIGEPIEPFGIL